jgi:choline dehydrogenase
MNPDVFDYVIVGAGAAGCIVANRLASNGKYTVCVLEAGPPDNNILLRIPAGIYKVNSDPNSKYVWQFATEAGEGIGGRSLSIPQGKTLGGSTSINGMKYNRGQQGDYDTWAQQGNRGWGYADVLPYFKRSERRIGSFDAFYRGSEGPLPVTDCDWRHPLYDAFIEAGGALGLPRHLDYNGASQSGVGYYQRLIQNGWRVSAARAFLRPLAKKRNVEIRTNVQATKILFEGKRATGISYVNGPQGETHTVRARREVVLSCGSANTPKLLQLSGVGPAEVLTNLGIQVLHDLPGVGANLQDHYMVDVIHLVKGIETTNGRSLQLLKEVCNWTIGRPSILAISPSAAYGFVNSQDLSQIPDIQLDFGEGRFIKQMADMPRKVPMMKLSFFQMRPRSTGYVHARSANPFDPPVIQPNYLSHREDQQAAIAGLKLVRRIFSTPELQQYSLCEELPGPAVTEDADLLRYAQKVGGTGYHLIGTCRMGPRDNQNTVVDDQLRVHGLQGLRIVDASIMPTMPSANTVASVFMIAEKASDMILGAHPARVEDSVILGKSESLAPVEMLAAMSSGHLEAGRGTQKTY